MWQSYGSADEAWHTAATAVGGRWKQRTPVCGGARWLASDGALSGPEAARFALEMKATDTSGRDSGGRAEQRRSGAAADSNDDGCAKTGGKAERIDSPLPRRRRTESRLLSVEEKLLRRWRPRAGGGGRSGAARRDGLLEHPETPRIGQKTARKAPETTPKNP
eukprot:COSAG06_NODE_969_length_11282_cov_10.397477_3_plen_163_part_00